MNIIITGSVAYDYLMNFPGLFRDNIIPDKLEHISLSFLVNSMVKRRGGIAPNIAYTLALLGGKPRVMATVGQDFAEYRSHLEKVGVDTSLMKVIPDEFTASFFCNTDQSNAQIASFYPGAMEDAATLSLNDLSEKPELVLVSPNDPAAMENVIQECKQLEIDYVYDPSQQIVRTDGKELQAGIEGAKAMFANEYEFEMVKKKTGLNLEAILENLEFLVITLGPKGSLVYHKGGIEKIEAAPTENIVDPTGGGDSFRGGFLTGYRYGFDWKICGRMGSLAATYCLENEGPQGFYFSLQEFIDRYDQLYGNEGKLNGLLADAKQ
jgi:adenosine kinase